MFQFVFSFTEHLLRERCFCLVIELDFCSQLFSGKGTVRNRVKQQPWAAGGLLHDVRFQTLVLSLVLQLERMSRKREIEKEEKVAVEEPQPKKSLFSEEHDQAQHSRSQRQKEEKTVLQKSLDYLHNILQRFVSIK